MKESKKSKNRSDFNGRENLKLKKLKEKRVLKIKEMLKKDKDLTQIDKLKKKNGRGKVVSKKLGKSQKDLTMKNQDILSNGELKRIENLKEFNVPKNLADWRLNLNLDLQEEDKQFMNSKFMNQDLFQ